MRGTLLAMALVLLAPGCTYRVRVESNPVGASLALPDGQVRTTPATVRFGYRPFRSQTVIVSAPEYRTMELSVRRDLVRSGRFLLDPLLHPRRAFGKRPRHTVQLRLVPTHGPVGTWTTEGEGLE